jgi:hypothetical protein
LATRYRRSNQKVLGVVDAKAKVLELIEAGHRVSDAMGAVDRTEDAYKQWMKTDANFKAQVAEIRRLSAELSNVQREPLPDFPTFCDKWLGQPLYPHQLRMWDVIEGRKPRDLPDGCDYRPGYPNRVLINVPPDHAKSTTFTVNYVVYKIHQNPNIRIVLMSQGRQMAERFLGEIKFKLTSKIYREMHMRFAPLGDNGEVGWKDPDGSWTNSAIYVKGKGGDKDPTVQALGLGGQIYGARADLIILDDIVTTKNAREIEKQEILLDREIDSRLPPEKEGGGLLAILGTRVAPLDLYRHLSEVRDGDDEYVWTHFRQPAVLNYGKGDSSTWTTLWPERYDGKSLSKRKRNGNWNLIYQQLDVDDDMTFNADAVNASINGGRFPGPMENGKHHREGGMADLYRVGGLDPAAGGNTAIVIAGLDRDTHKRWVMDGWNKPNASASQIIEKIKYFTELYQLHEWVIEKNAVQRFITELPEIVDFCRARGCKITPHYTTNNKFDEDWGIQTMAPLFDSCIERDTAHPRGWKKARPAQRLIDLPSTRQNQWVNDLVQQLTIWQPDNMAQHAKTDLVMALWFTHLAHTKIVNRKQGRKTHMDSPFLTPAGKARQKVIDLTALREERRMQEIG